MVLLTELPIFKHNISHLEQIHNDLQMDGKNKTKQNETDPEDVESGLRDCTPSSPTRNMDEGADDMEKVSSRILNSNK